MVMVPPPPARPVEITAVVPNMIERAREPEVMTFDRAGFDPTSVFPMLFGGYCVFSKGWPGDRPMHRGRDRLERRRVRDSPGRSARNVRRLAMRDCVHGQDRGRWVRAHQACTHNSGQQRHFSCGPGDFPRDFPRDFHGAPCELDAVCSAHDERSFRARFACGLEINSTISHLTQCLSACEESILVIALALSCRLGSCES